VQLSGGSSLGSLAVNRFNSDASTTKKEKKEKKEKEKPRVGRKEEAQKNERTKGKKKKNVVAGIRTRDISATTKGTNHYTTTTPARRRATYTMK
jgi:hypothetical protein